MKKNIVIKTLIVGILMGGLFSAAAAEKIEQKPLPGKPNIVLIFIDDMGYGDIGPFGSAYKTPHLDRMAAEGMKLTDFYVSSSACTPSRAALMTGCYADRIGMGASVVFPADKRGLNPSEITIAEILKKGGYATGCFGKWHLGDHPDFMPNNQGFDEYEGIPYSNDMWIPNKRRTYPPMPWMKQNKVVAHIPDAASQAVLTDAITDAAVDFIKRHKDQPFFAYVPHAAVHAPFLSTRERLAAAGGDVMAALISEVDGSVGRIMHTIRELGIADNTLLLFTNDNGGGGKTSPGPLRGAKFGPKYEGHMRVATLAWWPGRIPAGSVSSEIMTTTDVLPTLARLAGQPVPDDRIIDGKDVSDILLGKPGAKSPHETLYYENGGIRQGKWKLVHYRVKANWFTELYDLEADLGEKNNLADKHPDKVKALKAALDAHVAEIKKNTRLAGFVENPKPLLSEAGGLPTLAEYARGARRVSGAAVDRIVQSDRPTTLSGAMNSARFVPPPRPGVTLKDEWSTFPYYSAVGYDQPLRPQFHFTSRMGWLNDSNGMVYYDGEWHMLFQHYAKGNTNGPKSWGNAVSTDLMRWKQLPHAINPYPNVKWEGGNLHAIWSGSAVVDERNALGKQKGDVKTLYAIYTATHAGKDKKAAFFQGAAYSSDRGRTWTKINGGRPIIDHQPDGAGGQRDPRVFYYAPGKYYVVIMMVGGKDRAVRLWKSTDLLHWEILGDVPNKAAECIDMYHVSVDGDPAKRKWVIADAGTRYEVGDFDGKTWRGRGAKDNKGRPLRFDYGDAYYAAQAFNQAPDGRVVHVGWLRSKKPGYRPFLEANMPFTQQMSIPAEITLRTTPEGIRMFRNPVKEIESLYSKSTKLSNISAKEANAKLAGLSPELIDLTLTFVPKGHVALNVRGLRIHYNDTKQEFQFTNRDRVEGEKAGMLKLPKARQRPYRDSGLRAVPAPTVGGKVTLRVLVDRASLELFVNDGQAAASFVVVPKASDRRIAIEGNDTLKIDSLVVHELKSAWGKP
jgi:levanase/fructan beta-fructosidase